MLPFRGSTVCVIGRTRHRMMQARFKHSSKAPRSSNCGSIFSKQPDFKRLKDRPCPLIATFRRRTVSGARGVSTRITLIHNASSPGSTSSMSGTRIDQIPGLNVSHRRLSAAVLQSRRLHQQMCGCRSVKIAVTAQGVSAICVLALLKIRRSRRSRSAWAISACSRLAIRGRHLRTAFKERQIAPAFLRSRIAQVYHIESITQGAVRRHRRSGEP